MSYNSRPFDPLLPLPPPPPHHHSKSSKMMLYYGIAVVGTTAIVLLVYNFMVLRLCARFRRHMPRHQEITMFEPSSTSPSPDNPNMQIAIITKYKKEKEVGKDENHVHECPVCLSSFEDGEDVRQLQRCKHSFHAPCIDTWLQSHLDCPVCRASVRPLILWRHETTNLSENSREVLLRGSMSV